jgi:hypothetical protein
MERLKTTAGVVAALAGAVTGMWTIYEKVKSDAKQYTAASYETLAPQVNQMNEALRQLQEENQQLKKALLVHAEQRPRPARPRPATKPEGGVHGRPRRTGTTAGATPAPGTSAPAEAQEQPDDTLGRIVGTVTQTREAVEAVRKVPETFQKVLESRGKK